MRVVIQRVSRASVSVDGEVAGSIGPGLVVLLGIATDDTEADIDWLSNKIAALRIFNDAEGQMNMSICEVNGSALVVSQFTLYASYKKGNRPSYIRAARPEQAKPLYEIFCASLGHKIGSPVRTGIFGANMQVDLCNDGPVTISMDSKTKE